MNEHERRNNLLVAANLIELGSQMVEQLAGVALDGNEMEDTKDIFLKEFNRLLMEKADA